MLTREGINNIVYDAAYSKSGSSASGNITKPSWISGLGDSAKQAYRDLDDMYGLRKFHPSIGVGKTIELYYVHRDNVIDLPCVKAEVEVVGDGHIKVHGRNLSGDVQGDPVLIAAGVWCGKLWAGMPHIEPVTGVSFIFRKPEEYEPKFNIWAPYKQSISYNYDSHVWFGDGTAIYDKNWKEARVAKALERAREHGLEDLPLETNIGYRPYVKGYKNGYFAKVGDKTWVSTGGGKNGIVLAAVQARQFLEELKSSGYR